MTGLQCLISTTREIHNMDNVVQLKSMEPALSSMEAMHLVQVELGHLIDETQQKSFFILILMNI